MDDYQEAAEYATAQISDLDFDCKASLFDAGFEILSADHMRWSGASEDDLQGLRNTSLYEQQGGEEAIGLSDEVEFTVSQGMLQIHTADGSPATPVEPYHTLGDRLVDLFKNHCYTN